MPKHECCSPHQITTDFYELINAYILKKAGDAELAKDITQEVMGRMIDTYDKGIDIENIKAWLFQVTRNTIADHYRKKNIINYTDRNLDVEEDIDEPNISANDFIIPMIKLLPEEYGTPLYMSDIENMKQADIAEKLGLSLSATKMRCQRGRKKLHEMFLECCDIEYAANGDFAYCTIKSSCDVLLDEKKKMDKK